MADENENDVNVRVGLDVKRLEQQLREAGRRIADATNHWGKSFTRFGKVIDMLSSLADNRFFKTYKDHVTLLKKGTELTTLNVKALGQWSGAVKAAGGSAETAVATMTSLQKRLGGLRLGFNREMLKPLSMMGISAFTEDGKIKKANDLLMEMADKAKTMNKDVFATLAGQAGLSDDVIRMLMRDDAKKLLEQQNSPVTKEYIEELQKAEAAWQNICDIVQSKFYPVMAELYKFFNESVAPIVKSIAENLETWIIPLIGFLVPWTKLFKGFKLLCGLIQVIPKLLAKIKLPKWMTKLLDWIRKPTRSAGRGSQPPTGGGGTPPAAPSAARPAGQGATPTANGGGTPGAVRQTSWQRENRVERPGIYKKQQESLERAYKHYEELTRKLESGVKLTAKEEGRLKGAKQTIEALTVSKRNVARDVPTRGTETFRNTVGAGAAGAAASSAPAASGVANTLKSIALSPAVGAGMATLTGAAIAAAPDIYRAISASSAPAPLPGVYALERFGGKLGASTNTETRNTTNNVVIQVKDGREAADVVNGMSQNNEEELFSRTFGNFPTVAFPFAQ